MKGCVQLHPERRMPEQAKGAMSRHGLQSVSLVEVLIVAGVLAVLAAAFFPVVAQTRSRTGRSGMSLLHQFGVSAFIAVEDHDGIFPNVRPPSAHGPSPMISVQGGACVTNDSNFTTNAAGCEDLQTGLTWGESYTDITGGHTTWKGAADFCSSFVENGIGGWRVPTLMEMQTAATHNITHYVSATDWGAYRWSSTNRGKQYAYTNDLISSTQLFTVNSNEEATCVRP
ncbi:MAG TPA: DUF1566 domain-containing protein [Chthonomonadaceae bacterium]|nr:DUF1566 domain-containing protein [Chthonomonadaceae bacterium]